MTVKEEGHYILDVSGVPLTCAQASFSGAVAVTTEAAMKLSGGYSGCEFFGASTPTKMNSCYYLLHASGRVDVECSIAGDGITFSYPGCLLKIPAQTNLKGAGYSNIGFGATATITVSKVISGMKVELSGFLCASGTVAATVTTGPLQLTGEKSGSHVGMTHTP